MNTLQRLCQFTKQYVCVAVCIAYREHRGSEKTPCEKLQEDDNHSMVNTGLTDSLRLHGGRERQTEKVVSQQVAKTSTRLLMASH